MDAGTGRQRKNSIPTTNKVCRGHNKSICCEYNVQQSNHGLIFTESNCTGLILVYAGKQAILTNHHAMAQFMYLYPRLKLLKQFMVKVHTHKICSLYNNICNSIQTIEAINLLRTVNIGTCPGYEL